MTDMNPDFQYGPPVQPQQPVQPNVPTPPQGYPQQPVYAPTPAPNNYSLPPKQSKKWLILAIVFITTTLAAIGLGVWLYLNYIDQKDNTDAKISTAVTAAVKTQADKDAADFLEKEKQPNRQFAGPDDYGRLSFDYPKTWSIYVDEDAAKGGTYEAYFNPVSVPPIDASTQYALRVTIEQQDYENVLKSYDRLVQQGDLKTSAVKIDSTDGTRLDGSFSKDIRGAAVVFKIRDKTVTIRTDADTFIRNKTALDGTTAAAAPGDFDALIATITFNK